MQNFKNAHNGNPDAPIADHRDPHVVQGPKVDHRDPKDKRIDTENRPGIESDSRNVEEERINGMKTHQEATHLDPSTGLHVNSSNELEHPEGQSPVKNKREGEFDVDGHEHREGVKPREKPIRKK